MKRGYIMLNPDMVGRLLNLPEGVSVRSVNANWLMDGIEIMLEGDSLPADTEYIPGTVPTHLGMNVLVTEDGRIEVGFA